MQLGPDFLSRDCIDSQSLTFLGYDLDMQMHYRYLAEEVVLICHIALDQSHK